MCVLILSYKPEKEDAVLGLKVLGSSPSAPTSALTTETLWCKTNFVL